MTEELPNEIGKTFQTIINSIPLNFNERISIHDQKELSSFSKMCDIPLKSVDTYRQLAALLILNRLRFIVSYGKGPLDSKTIYATYQTTSDLLKQTYPQMFTSSIVDSIANSSTLVISQTILQFDQRLLNQSSDILSLLFLKVLNQRFRRKLGQFWTPKHIAEFMVTLSLENNPRNILDPCTGPGTFIQALQSISEDFQGKITGIELHPLLYEICKVNLYNSQFKLELKQGDFLTTAENNFENSIHDELAISSAEGLDSFLKTKSNGFDCIICNPPYSRHHMLSSRIKDRIGNEIEQNFGGKFNRISSLFMYFILKSLKLLIKDGRMVFITPTIIFESRNSDYLKMILKERYRVPYIIVFHHSLDIFPGVDTAACIFVIEGRKPREDEITKLLVVKKWTSKEKIFNYLKIESNEVFKWSDGELHSKRQIDIDPERNWTNPDAFTNYEINEKLVELSKFFKVMRGIATGNNSFFTFTTKELASYKIKDEFVVPTLTRTRYVQKYCFSKEDFNNLSEQEKKMWLLNIQEDISDIHDQNLSDYLELGLSQNVHNGNLVKTRKHWYKTEKRDIPYFIYTYLSRGNPRFILNEAQIRPLNTFLMIYPKKNRKLSKEFLILFWVILNSNITFDSLRNVGRCYGGNTLKIEPREMLKTLILNPFKITTKSKKSLLALSQELKSINTVHKKDLIERIDAIIDKELSS
ncbi:MAG: class I SAM-dependent DNA methyltransferase [Promethearchaeota archaeon]